MNVQALKKDRRKGAERVPDFIRWKELSLHCEEPEQAPPKRGAVLCSASEKQGSCKSKRFSTRASCPTDLADNGFFQQWLAFHGFTELSVPNWPDASYREWRDLISTVLAELPQAKILIDFHNSERPSHVLREVAGQWPGRVLFSNSHSLPDGSEGAGRQEFEERPKQGQLKARARLKADLEVAIRTFRKPETAARIAAKLVHVKEHALTPLLRGSQGWLGQVAAEPDGIQGLRLGEVAANSIIPGSGRIPAGIHIGVGQVLRPWCDALTRDQGSGSEVSGFHLLAVDHYRPAANMDRNARHVVFDPRKGKALKHDRVHAIFVGRNGTTQLANSALTVLGTSDRHIFLNREFPSGDGLGTFFFNENWQFIGMGIDRFEPKELGAHSKPVFVALRTSAIWDDLTALADLGSESAADSLFALNRSRFRLEQFQNFGDPTNRKDGVLRPKVRGGLGR